MSEERTETSPAEAQTSDSMHDKGGSLWILWSVIGLLLAYPLSIGPVALAYKDKHVPNFVYAVYEPLDYVCSHSSPVKRVMVWYLHLWGVR